jgi:HK97 family phage major capsid protein
MSLYLTEPQSLALRKSALPVLRALGVKNAADYQPHTLDWNTLHEHGKAVVRAARKQADTAPDQATEGEFRALEDAHDGLMALYDAIESEKDARNELGDRGPRKSDLHPNHPVPRDGEARGQDGGDIEFSDEPTEAFALRSGETFVDYIRRESRSPVEYGNLSVGAYLRAMVIGPKTDAEKRALSEGTDSAGGYTVPDILSARMIDRMRAASTVMRAGAQTVPLTSDVSYVAKVLTDPTPAWRNEAASIGESDPTFGRVTFTARSLAVLVKVSRELLEDSLNMETVLPRIIAEGMAAELDRVALLGSGTAPEPKGVLNFSGLTSNAFSTGALTSYTPLIQARTALRTVNSDVTAYIMSPRDDGTLAGLKATDNQPLMVPPAIANVPMLVTSKIPTNGGSGTNESNIFAGDWSRLMIGVRSQLQIGILRERYADTGQYAFVAHLRADVAAEQEAAFTVIEAITA